MLTNFVGRRDHDFVCSSTRSVMSVTCEISKRSRYVLCVKKFLSHMILPTVQHITFRNSMISRFGENRFAIMISRAGNSACAGYRESESGLFDIVEN